MQGAQSAAARSFYCDDPDSIPDAEIDGIAKWAWGLRCRNTLYVGRNSVYQMPRSANDTLLPISGGLPAFGLLGFLADTWGHQQGKPFAISPRAIVATGRLKMGQNQIYAAIELLIEAGFLIRVHQSRGKGDPSRYLLGRGRGISTYIGHSSGDAKAEVVDG